GLKLRIGVCGWTNTAENGLNEGSPAIRRRGPFGPRFRPLLAGISRSHRRKSEPARRALRIGTLHSQNRHRRNSDAAATVRLGSRVEVPTAENVKTSQSVD